MRTAEGSRLVRRGALPASRRRRSRGLPLALVLTNPAFEDNPIVYANPAFAKLTGYPLEAVIGRNCRFLQGPATEPDRVARIRAAVAAGEDIAIEITNHRADGTPFLNRLTITAVRDDEAGERSRFYPRHPERRRRRDRREPARGGAAAARRGPAPGQEPPGDDRQHDPAAGAQLRRRRRTTSSSPAASRRSSCSTRS